MARLRVKANKGRYRVTMSGHVSARDLRRLERLCGPALEWQTPPLTLHLMPATTFDPTAHAFVEHLVRRGAVLQVD